MEMLRLMIPVLLLAGILVAPRRRGRPVSHGAKVAAVFVLLCGSLLTAVAVAWDYLIGPVW